MKIRCPSQKNLKELNKVKDSSRSVSKQTKSSVLWLSQVKCSNLCRQLILINLNFYFASVRGTLLNWLSQFVVCTIPVEGIVVIFSITYYCCCCCFHYKNFQQIFSIEAHLSLNYQSQSWKFNNNNKRKV